MTKPNSTRRPPRIGLISLGCAKNLVDAEVMIGTLLKDGVEITNDSSGNLIGGATEAERNIIFSNQSAGVRISDPSTTNNTVQGNYIGLGLGPIRQAFTSGLAISGGMLLAPAAFLFIAGMFASGIVTALIIYGKKY